MKSRGLHIIGDLWGCDLSALPLDESGCLLLRERVSALVAEYSLTELGNTFHFFAPRAVTATVTLSESHLAFHSWPEDGFVSIDLFVCNYTADNTIKARALFSRINAELFKPNSSEVQEIQRFYRDRAIIQTDIGHLNILQERRYGNS